MNNNDLGRRIFWIDRARNIEISYLDFLKDLNEGDSGNIFIKDSNPYMVFFNMLKNFKNGQESVLLDCDFSRDELFNLGITDQIISNGEYSREESQINFLRFQDLLFHLKDNMKVIHLDMYTSGTTGRPKRVTHSLENLIRGVKEQRSYRKNTWGLAYNPTHFAGLQVFFQALFNGNTIVNVFGSDFERISWDIDILNITHISSTPTFFKMLLPHVKAPKKGVVNLTFGGERFDSRMENLVKDKFPNAAIRNVYASTEAGSLLVAEGEYFVIPDKYRALIKIYHRELLIHKNLLGDSNSLKLDGDWYKTGDIVDQHEEGRFKFRNRKSEMINVGGYKVNPIEVEEVIKSINGVADAAVFGRRNSLMGQIVVANIIIESDQNKEDLKNRIRQVTSLELQDFKLPRVINFVESFILTRTGKIKK